jgi:hypothetical protein
MLARNAQAHPARAQDLHAGTVHEKIGNERRGLEEMLEIVDHHEEMPVTQERRHARREGLIPHIWHTHRLRDGRGNEVRIANRRQRDECNAVGIAAPEIGRDLKRQPGLADATRAGQCEQRHVVTREQGPHVRHLALAADKRRHRTWQGHRRAGRLDRAQRSRVPLRRKKRGCRHGRAHDDQVTEYAFTLALMRASLYRHMAQRGMAGRGKGLGKA